MANDADVRIGADLSSLESGLRLASSKLQSWGKNIASIGAGIFGAGVAILGPLAASVLHFAEMGSQLNDMSERTGASVEALSELGFAAELSGASLEELETGLKFMSRTIGQAASGSAEAAKKLEDLGIRLADLNGLTQDQRFALFADRIADIEDPAQRAAAAMAIFGRSGTMLLPMIADGSAGLRQMREEARRLGLTMSTEDAAAADRLGDAIDTLKKQFKALIFQVGASIAPLAQGFLKGAIEVTASVIAWIKNNRWLVVTLLAIGTVLVTIGGLIAGLGGTMIIFGALIAAIKAAGIALLIVAGVFGTVALYAVVAAGIAYLAWTYFGDKIQKLFSQFIDSDFFAHWIGPGIAMLGRLVDTARTTGSGIMDAMATGNLQLAWDILIAGLKVAWLDFKIYFIENFGGIIDIVLRMVENITIVFQAAITAFRTSLEALISTYNAVQASSRGVAFGAIGNYLLGNGQSASGPSTTVGQTPVAADAADQLQEARDNLARLVQQAARDRANLVTSRGGATDLSINGNFDSAGAFGGAGLSGFGVVSRFDRLIEQAERQTDILDEIRRLVEGNPGDEVAGADW